MTRLSSLDRGDSIATMGRAGQPQSVSHQNSTESVSILRFHRRTIGGLEPTLKYKKVTLQLDYREITPGAQVEVVYDSLTAEEARHGSLAALGRAFLITAKSLLHSITVCEHPFSYVRQIPRSSSLCRIRTQTPTNPRRTTYQRSVAVACPDGWKIVSMGTNPVSFVSNVPWPKWTRSLR